MLSEKVCDVRGLPPPEPFEKIIAALTQLQRSEYLKVLHHREPLPLYPTLKKLNFDYRPRKGDRSEYEILIWRADDNESRKNLAEIVSDEK